MTKTNEILWKEYHEEGNEAAFVELYEKNKGIIKKCAKDWMHCYGVTNIEEEDLCSAGNEGFMAAVKMYDPQKEVLFITYAKHKIDAFMQRYLLKNAGLIHLPENKLRTVNRIKKCRPEGANPDSMVWYESFCDKYDENISYEHFCALAKMAQDFSGYSSLNELLGDDQTTERQDFIGDMENPEEMYLKESLKDEIEKCLGILTEREQQVIILYFGLNGKGKKSLKEIGKELDISTTRAGEIKEKALWTLNQSSKAKGLREYL